jgi:hypothetical protein
MSAKKQTAGTPAPSHLDLSTPVSKLPKRFQNLFEKRREENMVSFKLCVGDAEAEARQHVARRMYVEATRKAEKAKQMQLLALPLRDKRRVV